MAPVVTSLYAAALAVLMIVLSFRISLARRRSGVSLGWGEDMHLAERVRAFGNFAEWVPMALVLMAMAEIGGAPPGAIHASGLFLVAGRLVHPVQLRGDALFTPLRFLGMVGTYLAILTAAYHLLRLGAGI